jgi:putative ATPase
MSDLFADAARERLPNVAPLALRLRPDRLKEFVGQQQVVGEGSALARAIADDRIASSIFYGPPGSGKTTLAHLVVRRRAQPSKSSRPCRRLFRTCAA